MLATPTTPTPLATSIDLEQLFPRRGTAVYTLTEDAPLFCLAAGDLVVVETGAAAPLTSGALAAVSIAGEPVPRVRRYTLNVRGRVASLASGVPGARELHLPAANVRVLGRVVGVIRRYA